MRRAILRAGALLTVSATGCIALTGGSVALAASSPSAPFSPGIPQQPTSSPPTTAPPVTAPASSSTSASPTSDTGLGGGSAIAIAIGAIVVLGGISFFIWHDARRRAPVRARAAAAAGVAGGADGGRAGSKQRTKPRKLSPAERRRRKRGRAR